jgi:hypothetical protein
VDKANGRRLLKKTRDDKSGYLTPAQIERVERHARARGVKALWAGGFHMRDAYELGKLGVFGIYVTSAAATTIPVGGSYVRDPALAGVKEPSKEAVLRTKILLEAGFLSSRTDDGAGRAIASRADRLLAAIDEPQPDVRRAARDTETLAKACVDGWRSYWRKAGRP